MPALHFPAHEPEARRGEWRSVNALSSSAGMARSRSGGNRIGRHLKPVSVSIVFDNPIMMH